MNIMLNTQISTAAAAGTESAVTHRISAQGVWNDGYKLDIADRVMDNEAYGQGMTVEDIMQQAANTDVDVQKNLMIVMSNTVSGEDFQKMQEEGFKPGSTDVETYVNITDKIKVALAQAGVEITGYTDDLDVEKAAEITGSSVDAQKLVKDLAQMLSESDIPITDENICGIAEAAAEAMGITELSDEAVRYLVVNQKAPTIENLYKAQFVVGLNNEAGARQQPQGYYSEGIAGANADTKYYAKKADSISWDNLKGQLESAVSRSGLDTDAQTKESAMESAKWLVESGIELNAGNLARVFELKGLSLPMEQEAVEKLCVAALENGKSPSKALMTGEASIAEQAREIFEAVESISDAAVHAAVEDGIELNIRNLSQAQRNIDAAQDEAAFPAAESAFTQETGLEETRAMRQLEEIRLMMTEEANRQLLRAGISIDTTELSELVETLKQTEERLQAVLFKGEGAEENAQRALIYEETLTKTEELADMPAALAGKAAFGAQAYTLNQLHAEGVKLQRELEQDGEAGQNQGRQQQAAQAYETLMTAPRRDLGDSIRKAFRNVDDILEDMDLETSEANRRAVRILGYNSMEITEENINAVKEADSQISGVIGRMTPAAVLQMIREQKNPLEMTIGELDGYLNERESDLSAESEKYSVFLQRLDRAGGITESEREAYIGIYRLFNQIERSDGAVIGSVVAAGAQMNFKNMLSAVRSAKDKDIDVRIDDGFGALEELITKGKAIDGQIMSGFQNQADSDSGRQQERYYARLSGEINTELSEKTDLEKLKTVDISSDTTIEQFADSIKMTQMDAEQQQEWQRERLKSFQENLQESVQADERIIEELLEYGQPVSMDNIEAAQLLMMDRGSLFRQLVNKEEREDSGESGILEKAESFAEALTDSESAGGAYDEIINEAQKTAMELIYQGGASAIDIKAAQSLCKGLSLAGRLAREENYEVPMDIKGEITSVNLKIYRNSGESGRVTVTLETDALGKVAAEFDVTGKSVSGMAVYEKRAAQADLVQLEEGFEKELSELAGGDGKRISVSLVQSDTLDLSRFGQKKQETDSRVSTAELYQTAKAFLTALKDIS